MIKREGRVSLFGNFRFGAGLFSFYGMTDVYSQRYSRLCSESRAVRQFAVYGGGRYNAARVRYGANGGGAEIWRGNGFPAKKL